MEWLDEFLDKLFNDEAFKQFPPFREMQNLRPSLNQMNFVGDIESKNVEDRRLGFTEQDRINALWKDEHDRVRRAMSNSLLRRIQNVPDAFPYNPPEPIISIIMNGRLSD